MKRHACIPNVLKEFTAVALNPSILEVVASVRGPKDNVDPSSTPVSNALSVMAEDAALHITVARVEYPAEKCGSIISNFTSWDSALFTFRLGWRHC